MSNKKDAQLFRLTEIYYIPFRGKMQAFPEKFPRDFVYGCVGAAPRRKGPPRSMRRNKVYLSQALAAVLLRVLSVTAFATGTGDPLAVINKLSDFIFGLIRAVGMILLGWGIVQVGLSLQSHDPSQRSNGFLTLAGALSSPSPKRF